MPIPEPVAPSSGHIHPSRRRAYHYFHHTTPFVFVLYADSYHARCRMVVLQDLATGHFVTVTTEEFKRNWVEEGA